MADRAGISRATLQKIEKGDLACARGLVFEVAVLVGIKLFHTESVVRDFYLKIPPRFSQVYLK